jgi:hypothetical protein
MSEDDDDDDQRRPNEMESDDESTSSAPAHKLDNLYQSMVASSVRASAAKTNHTARGQAGASASAPSGAATAGPRATETAGVSAFSAIMNNKRMGSGSASSPPHSATGHQTGSRKKHRSNPSGHTAGKGRKGRALPPTPLALPPHHAPGGLINGGRQNCFANAALQALRCCDRFSSAVADLDIPLLGARLARFGDVAKLLQSLKRLMQPGAVGDFKFVEDLKSGLDSIQIAIASERHYVRAALWPRFIQQDSQEFMLDLFSAITETAPVVVACFKTRIDST